MSSIYGTRAICLKCKTSPCSKSCSWVDTRYPTHYTGKRNYTNVALKELEEIMPGR